MRLLHQLVGSTPELFDPESVAAVVAVVAVALFELAELPTQFVSPQAETRSDTVVRSALAVEWDWILFASFSIVVTSPLTAAGASAWAFVSEPMMTAKLESEASPLDSWYESAADL